MGISMTISKIEWTDRSDWNPIRGCTRVSPGCGGPGKLGGCYAEAMAARFSKPGQWGHGFAEMRNGEPRWTGRVALIPERLALPLRWKKPADIFASSTSDMFHEALSDDDIAHCWAYMTAAYWHRFQVLTKRPERARQLLDGESFREMVSDYLDGIDVEAGELGLYDPLARITTDWRAQCPDPSDDADWPIRNILLGTSCEDQQRADERIPLLLQTPAAVRFVSLEPLLGPIDIDCPQVDWMQYPEGNGIVGDKLKLDWVIVGGESGPHARPMHPEWARSLRDQCGAASIPFFFKQWGAWRPHQNEYPRNGARAGVIYPDGRFQSHALGDPLREGADMFMAGKKAAGRLLDGVEHSELPAVTR